MAANINEFLTDLIEFSQLKELDQSLFTRHYDDRDPGRLPSVEEDPFNSIVRFCEVRGAQRGVLAGMRVGVKDKIAVAAVPMTLGVEFEKPPVPTEDALVVRRLLDAGATITAKTNLGQSPTGARNPHDSRYSPANPLRP